MGLLPFCSLSTTIQVCSLTSFRLGLRLKLRRQIENNDKNSAECLGGSGFIFLYAMLVHNNSPFILIKCIVSFHRITTAYLNCS